MTFAMAAVSCVAACGDGEGGCLDTAIRYGSCIVRGGVGDGEGGSLDRNTSLVTITITKAH